MAGRRGHRLGQAVQLEPVVVGHAHRERPDLVGRDVEPDAQIDPPPPVVLASEHPTIFLAGAHLGEIAELKVAPVTIAVLKGILAPVQFLVFLVSLGLVLPVDNQVKSRCRLYRAYFRDRLGG